MAGRKFHGKGRHRGRSSVPEADKILDKEFPVLDKGFVRLVDYMGGDERIVQSARVSYGSGTKTYRATSTLRPSSRWC